ncbi:MAG: hypothetical protein CUN55_09530 [Phototrophicales bacterium]|nr:MAG: hypothetical protein CUN55_09530 [Phototrophicales bacterium]
MTIRIVTDSTSDLLPEWIEQYKITVIPAFVQFGNESFADDGIALPREEFYRRLIEQDETATTSAMPIGLCEEMMQKALQEADHVIAITLSSELSGIHNVMKLAAQNLALDRITVYDSRTLTMALGWIVLAAAQAADAGESLDNIKALIEDLIERAVIYAGFDTLEYVRRGGRVSALAATVGGLLQIKPLFQVVNGRVEIIGRVRTMSRMYSELEKYAQDVAPFDQIAYIHTHAPERAEKLRDNLASLNPHGKTHIVEATTAIGAQIGPGAFGFAAIRSKR